MKQYDVAAYVWPSYTGDEPRTRIFWPKGIGEWQTVQDAQPKFEGHRWPRYPAWGYVNEADPAVMEMEINQAVRHGVNVFIYDWYWYDRRPFLENCLNDGFLKAKNNTDMRFYLMWANHNVNHLWDKRLAGTEPGKTVIWQGTVDRQDFEVMARRMVEKYFSVPNYYKIDGKPVLMIYDVENLVKGFGSIADTCDALQWMRRLVEENGHPGLHLQLCIRGDRDPKPEFVGQSCTYAELTNLLGADSVTNYQTGQLTSYSGEYLDQLHREEACWKKIDEQYTVPYFPHISCGWDNNPRHQMLKPSIIVGNTPENLEKALLTAREYVDNHDLPVPLITVNSWNEWTEGSYLQPDDIYGYGYLEAVKRVFAK